MPVKVKEPSPGGFIVRPRFIYARYGFDPVENTRPTERFAGCVICRRQRPPTAKGFAFFSLEDEIGIANAIVNPHPFERNRQALAGEPYLRMEGILQNQGSALVEVGMRYAPNRAGSPTMRARLPNRA